MLLNRGIYLTKLRRDAEAVAALERAIALDPGHDPRQLDVARRTLATAQGRLREGREGARESPEALDGPAVPR